MAITLAGAVIEISPGVPATYDAAGFGAVTPLTALDQLTNIGSFGSEYADVTLKLLSKRSTVHTKGTFDTGTIDLTLAFERSDPGNVLLEDFANSTANVDKPLTVKMTYNNGDITYFQALVGKFVTDGGSGDDNVLIQTSLLISDQGTIAV